MRITRKAYKDTMNGALKTSVEGPLINVLAYIEDLFVSFDFKGTHASSAVEEKLSMVMGGDMVGASWSTTTIHPPRAMRLALLLGMAPPPAMWPKGIWGFPGESKLYIMITSPSYLSLLCSGDLRFL